MKTANLSDRFKGFLVDYVLWMLISLIGFGTAEIVSNGLITIGLCLLPFLLKDVTGQSPGKKIAGTKIVRSSDFKQPNFLLLIFRTFFFFILMFDIPFLFFREDNKRLVDILLRTSVVKSK